MKVRPWFWIFVISTLVFNQGAAAVHVVSHVSFGSEFSQNGVHAFSSSQVHESHPGHDEHSAHDHKSVDSHQTTHRTDSAVTCLSYHVLLATPGFVSAAAQIVQPSVKLTKPSALLAPVQVTARARQVSNRGPPSFS